VTLFCNEVVFWLKKIPGKLEGYPREVFLCTHTSLMPQLMAEDTGLDGHLLWLRKVFCSYTVMWHWCGHLHLLPR